MIDETHQPVKRHSPSTLSQIKYEWPILMRLGSPILIGQMAQMLNGVIDTIMAGRAGASDLAGVAIGNSLWVPLFLFVMGLLNATQPIISEHRGARKFSKILPVTWNAIYIAIAASVLSGALLTHVSPVLTLIQLDSESARITTGYLKAFSLGLPAIFILVAIRGLTDGLGHTKIFMSFALLTACINTPLNYVFIYGKLGIPAMGGIGCGWATAISQWSALLLLAVYLHYSRWFKDYHLWRQWMPPKMKNLSEILRLGIPIGFTIFVEATMFAVVALLIAPLGTAVVAGHQIALNVISILFMVPLSLGLALTLRISFLVGAKQPETARLVARSSIFLVLIIALILGSLLFVFATPIAALYSTDPIVIGIAATLLGYGAMFQAADILQVVAISALRGYKDTKISAYIMLVSFWVIGIPVGYVLTYKDWIVPALGAPGFWIGLIAGLSNAAFWLLIRLFIFSKKSLPKQAAVR